MSGTVLAVTGIFLLNYITQNPLPITSEVRIFIWWFIGMAVLGGLSFAGSLAFFRKHFYSMGKLGKIVYFLSVIIFLWTVVIMNHWNYFALL